ncbi:MAG: hypothetical protein NTV34_01945 [Proteobacteria bacterium]|nr:hypothetical protein [Pseudomonadota bacterium]
MTSQAFASDSLIAISDPAIRVDRSPEFADVQPTAFVNFAFGSCVSQPLTAVIVPTVVENKVATEVSVVNLDGVDCHGPIITRRYELQISSDYQGERVLVKNPTLFWAPTF